MKSCILYTSKHNDNIFIDNIQYYEDVIIKYIAYNRNVPSNETYRNIPIISMNDASLFYGEIDTVLVGNNIEEQELIKTIAVEAINKGKDIYICTEISNKMYDDISELAFKNKCKFFYLNTKKDLTMSDTPVTENIIIMSLYFNPDSYRLQLALAQFYGFDVDHNAPFPLFINKDKKTSGKIHIIPELVYTSVSKTNEQINDFKKLKQKLSKISKVILVIPYDNYSRNDVLRKERVISKLYQVNIDEIIIGNYIVDVFSNPKRLIKRNSQNIIGVKPTNNRLISIDTVLLRVNN